MHLAATKRTMMCVQELHHPVQRREVYHYCEGILGSHSHGEACCKAHDNAEADATARRIGYYGLMLYARARRLSHEAVSFLPAIGQR